MINPIQSDALRGLYIRKTKNDAVDAQIIADVVRFGRYCKTKLLLLIYFLCVNFVANAFTLLTPFGKSSLELLSIYTTPEQMLEVDSNTLAELLKKASHGRFGLDKALEIQDKARNSFGIVMASSSFALIIRQLIEQIKSLEDSIAAFDKEIERLFGNFDTQLTTITGIGTTLAATIFSEIGGNIQRFSESGKLAAFAGIAPTVKQSSEFTGTKNKMSKRTISAAGYLACLNRCCL